MKTFPHTQSPLKSKLTRLEKTIGTWLTIPHQSVVEILASAGFEWMVIDMEHAAIDIQTLQNIIGHIQGNGMEALVRVSKNEEIIIKHAMDAGANGIIVPMINTNDDAKKAVGFVKYPPAGCRGVGLSRAQHYGTGFDSYKKWLEKEAVIIMQIEHIDSVNNLENILKVDCIDGIIVGPYDLSASMGMPGEYSRTEVQQAISEIEKITLQARKSLGTHVVSSDSSQLLSAFNRKYNFFAFGIDFFFMGDKAREEMLKIKKSESWNQK
ncbi:MAG: aldolase/citrate lyase family protein [Bacteroidota bacterium]